MTEKMESPAVSTLTDRKYWEQYWEEGTRNVPEEIELVSNKYNESFYSVFRRFLEPDKAISVVEIGGAPGLIVSSLTKIHDRLDLSIVDYSDKGVAETKEVSEKFGNDIAIYQKDIYTDDLSELPEFDIVYSLGVVEHYEDIELSLNKHLEITRDGGLVILGLPVFLGLNHWLAKRLAPKNQSTWYPPIMDNRNWKRFYDRPDIEVLADEYVGGFNPHVHHRLENKDRFSNRVIYVLLHKYFATVWDKLPGTQKLNSKYFSFYYFFVVRKLPHGDEN